MASGEGTAPGGGAAGGIGKTSPRSFDISVAHQARIYDYLLGGKDNFTADREAVEVGLKIWPGMAFAARANRAFLGRVVRYLVAEAGVRQFLDIGTGIPTAGNTHQVAQAIAPETRVVYVDYDPVVLAHARALLNSHDSGATAYVDADLRDTDTILARASHLLDFAQPVAVTLLTILHVIPDSDGPYEIVAKLMNAVPPGSYLAISHMSADLLDPNTQESLTDAGRRLSQEQLSARSHEQVARFFAGMDLVEPGLVPVEKWRQERSGNARHNSATWGAVGRKRT